MNRKLVVAALLITIAPCAATREKAALPNISPQEKSCAASQPRPPQHSFQHQDAWYEFMLNQFNPGNKNYGNWIEERRNRFLDARIKNPYFAYSACISIGMLAMTTICVKLRMDHRRAMWITAEMMADLYGHDAYSRQIAQDAIDRYNQHVEKCNRAIEAQDEATPATRSEMEQLRTELMRVAEERDNAIKERDTAREDLQQKHRILADLSLRLEAQTAKSVAVTPRKSPEDLRGSDPRLIAHINKLQEQLYAERNLNRRARGDAVAAAARVDQD